MKEASKKRVRRPPRAKKSLVTNEKRGEVFWGLRSSDSLRERRSWSMVLGWILGCLDIYLESKITF